jgi:hypothetical protein
MMLVIGKLSPVSLPARFETELAVPAALPARVSCADASWDVRRRGHVF